MGLIRRGESAGTPLRFRTSGVRCLFSRACPPQLRDGDAGFRLTRARSFRGRGMPRPCIGESERCSWLRRALTPQVRDGDAGKMPAYQSCGALRLHRYAMAMRAFRLTRARSFRGRGMSRPYR